MLDATALASLPDDIRARLERFVAAVDRVRLERLPTYAARPLDKAAHDAAADRVREAATSSGRAPAIRSLEQEVTKRLLERYAVDQFRPQILAIDYTHSTGAVGDRLAVARSLGEAMAALALSDLLDESDVDELVGAWVELAD